MPNFVPSGGLEDGGSNDPATLTSLLKQKTGISWYYSYAPKYSGCPEGVMVLSKWPILSKSQYFMSYQRSIAQATLSIGGKSVNVSTLARLWETPSNGVSDLACKVLHTSSALDNSNHSTSEATLQSPLSLNSTFRPVCRSNGAFSFRASVQSGS